MRCKCQVLSFTCSVDCGHRGPRLAKGLDSAEGAPILIKTAFGMLARCLDDYAGAKPIWWMSPPRSCRSPFRARRPYNFRRAVARVQLHER